MENIFSNLFLRGLIGNSRFESFHHFHFIQITLYSTGTECVSYPHRLNNLGYNVSIFSKDFLLEEQKDLKKKLSQCL